MDERHLILGTAGHIDHGKTALVGALSGIDTDRLAEEKERGISIEIGFAHMDLGGRRVGIVDLPGHERFIRNMLAGASGVDVAVLVVAADDSVMPQTREHFAILRLLQVKRGVIAITKADLVDPDWIDMVEDDVRELVAGSFLEDATIVRTSAHTGEGIDDLRAAIATQCEAAAAEDEGEGLFRLAVDRSFTMPGLGTVVTGTVWSGSASVGDELAWLPSNERVRIRGIQSHGDSVERVDRGRRAAINLIGVHHTDIDRGHELAAPGYLQPTRRLSVWLDTLPDAKWSIRHRARVRLHIGTNEVIATVGLLRGNELAPGTGGPAQLFTSEPIVATARQPFVVRAESPLITLGGGSVLQPDAVRVRRRDTEMIECLDELRAEDDTTRASAAIRLATLTAWDARTMARWADVDEVRAEALIAELDAAGALVTLPLGGARTQRVHKDVFDAFAKRLRTTLMELHKETPLATSVPRSKLAGRFAWIDADVFRGLTEAMRSRSLLRGDEHALQHPKFEPALNGAQRKLLESAAAIYEAAAFKPPDPSELARNAGVSDDDCRAVLELCVAEGQLVHVEGALYLGASVEDELRRRVTEHLSGGGEITMSGIRDLLDTSRKYAVPIGEYLDRVGITRRRGDVRILRT